MAVDYVSPVGLGAYKSNVERYAESIAQQLNFKAGDSIQELVEQLGGQIVFGSSGEEDVASGSIIASSINNFTIYLSRYTSLARDKFTVAHELGHLLLHLSAIKEKNPDAVMRATRYVDNSDLAQKRAEWEANWFAAAFLMPRTEFEEVWRQGGSPAVQMHFDVSRSAADIRARSLGLN